MIVEPGGKIMGEKKKDYRKSIYFPQVVSKNKLFKGVSEASMDLESTLGR